MKKISNLSLLLLLIVSFFAGCFNDQTLKKDDFTLISPKEISLEEGNTFQIEIQASENVKKSVSYGSSDVNCANISSDLIISALNAGVCDIVIGFNSHIEKIQVTVLKKNQPQLSLTTDKEIIKKDEIAQLKTTITPDDSNADIVITTVEGKENTIFDSENLTVKGIVPGGFTKFIANYGNIFSNEIVISVIENNAEIIKPDYVTIWTSRDKLRAGETATLNYQVYPENSTGVITYEVTEGKQNIQVHGNTIVSINGLGGTVVGKFGGVVSNKITIKDYNGDQQVVKPESITLKSSSYKLRKNETAFLTYTTIPALVSGRAEFVVLSGAENIILENNVVRSINGLSCQIIAKIGDVSSNIITISGDSSEGGEITEDPYKNINEQEFYFNYQPATSYMDAYFRTQHNFMSGDIYDQDQRPTIDSNRPKDGDKYIKNADMHYSADKNTYYVVNSKGLVIKEIYKCGAYTTLEDVASYTFAFSDAPVNYSSSKDLKPTKSKWGKYLRLNNSHFDGNVNRYPNEPRLPEADGLGGYIKYYEIDIGTTGTDCNPAYPTKIYNDGKTITRGAARIVYSKTAYGKTITDVKDKHIFYTYTHYSDFMEYLNYYNGWGESFHKGSSNKVETYPHVTIKSFAPGAQTLITESFYNGYYRF